MFREIVLFVVDVIGDGDLSEPKAESTLLATAFSSFVGSSSDDVRAACTSRRACSGERGVPGSRKFDSSTVS